MKNNVIYLLLFVTIVSIGAAFNFYSQAKQQPKFYDGNGNQLPYKAVNLLVRSQFITITRKEQDSLNR